MKLSECIPLSAGDFLVKHNLDLNFKKSDLPHIMELYANHRMETMPFHVKEGITNTKVSIQNNIIVIEPNP